MAINLCSVIGGNTGGIDCDVKRAVPKKFAVGGKEFSSSEYADSATLQAALLAAMILPNGDSDKLYPFPEILQVGVETEADTTGGLALGPQRRLRKGRPAYVFSCEIGQYQYQKLLAFDGKTLPVFTFDDENNLWGYRAAADTNTVNVKPFKGEQAYITISGNGFKDGNSAEAGVAQIRIAFLSVDDFEKRSAFASLPNLSSGDLVGLKDVILSEPQAHASNVHKVAMKIANAKVAGDINIFDDYGTAIAALSWTAFTGATFATSLTITSIAVDNTLKCLTVTFDSTAYTALSSGAKIKLVPPTAAVLDAADVTGIEIEFIILTK